MDLENGLAHSKAKYHELVIEVAHLENKVVRLTETLVIQSDRVKQLEAANNVLQTENASFRECSWNRRT